MSGFFALLEQRCRSIDSLLCVGLDPRAASATEARTLALEIVPVTCGSAFKNKGVQALLDKVIELMPSPTEVPPNFIIISTVYLPYTKKYGHY